MSATPLISVAKRLLANVDGDRGDLSSDILNIPATDFLDPERFEREIEIIFQTIEHLHAAVPEHTAHCIAIRGKTRENAISVEQLVANGK